MGDLSDFQRGLVGALSAGASVNKNTTSLGVFRAAVSKVMMPYTNHGKTRSSCITGKWWPKSVLIRECVSFTTVSIILSIPFRSTFRI
jgi:hypothetical protein